MPDIKLLAIVSDLHAGSTYGILPPGFHTRNGNEIGLNDYQKWIWDCWGDCWGWFDKLRGKEDYTLVMNGDAVDGFHHGTTEIWTNDESEHGIAAYHVLKEPASKAASVFLTEGTESHTRGHEHGLAYQLKAKGSKVIMPKGSGGAWPTLDISVHGTRIKFDHHIGTSMRSYLEASQLGIVLGNMRSEYARAGHDCPKVLVRAHRHRYGLFSDGYGMTVVTPAWQLLTRFGRRVVPDAVPQIGIVVLDWRDKEKGELPDVQTRLHTIKQSSPIKL
jgi:hypothetical protein